jgi:hypothetical protein
MTRIFLLIGYALVLNLSGVTPSAGDTHSGTINTAGNTSHQAVFQNITVDASGTMNLYFNPTTPGSDNSLGMLCYFILDKTN